MAMAGHTSGPAAQAVATVSDALSRRISVKAFRGTVEQAVAAFAAEDPRGML